MHENSDLEANEPRGIRLFEEATMVEHWDVIQDRGWLSSPLLVVSG